jgi:Ca2+-binding RTX toxin-like protein
MATLKPFVINQSDLDFLLAQVTFLPLFDVGGNAIIGWDGTGAVYDKYGTKLWDPAGGYVYHGKTLTSANVVAMLTGLPLFDISGLEITTTFTNTMVAYDSHGTKVWDPVATGGYAYHGTALNAGNLVSVLGHSYASVTDLAGLRDPSGLNNNLNLVHATWGTVDQPFTHTDATPNQPLGDVKPKFDGYVQAVDPVALGSYGATHGGFDLSIAAPGVQYAAATDYKVTFTGNTPTINNVVDYTPRMISQTVTTGGVTMLTEGDLGVTGANAHHIVYNTPFLSDGVTANPNYNAAGIAGVALINTAAPDGGYGLLQTLGHTDFQKTLADGTPDPTQAGSTEFFIGAENPGVAPTNGWFTLFGQFFDHGLDFIDKNSGAKITIALAVEDPLYGLPGPDGRPVTSITINRATISGKDANGNATYNNQTSPFIDQSQTYGSNEQVTNLLREWVADVSTANPNDYRAGMKLFDGNTLVDAWNRVTPDGVSISTHSTLPTLAELRAHLVATGRADLSWEDLSNLRNRDASGHIATGALAGLSDQSLLLDSNPHFDAAHFTSAAAQAALTTLGLTLDGTGNLVGGFGALAQFVNLANFSIQTTLNGVPNGTPLTTAQHSAINEILLASVGDHYIAGDGRVNENFGLTAVHHVFHEEHNYEIMNVLNQIVKQDVHNADGHKTLHSWQDTTGTSLYTGTTGVLATNAAGDVVIVDGTAPPPGSHLLTGFNGVNIAATGNYVNSDGSIAWDMDKLFSAAKLVVEMEYQHAAVDQYARTITPHIKEFVGYDSAIDPAVSLEYSQVAFRFGHSTLRETIDVMDPTGGLTGKIMSYALKSAFLSPETFAAEGPAAVALGMSHQQMNEVDEFITPALNQGLLGLPLDLGAINIARGRDLGIPALNQFRQDLGLTRYISWADFGQNMIHPESLANFIAAYAFDGDLAKAQYMVGLFEGTVLEVAAGDTDRAFAFMSNDTTAAVPGATAFNLIDTWIGGLAEAHVPGGLLGSTFDLVFTTQIENLMDGDRFYYLYRLFGQQFGEEVNNGQFKDIVERNTGLTHLNGSIFAYADQYYDLSADANLTTTALENDLAHHKYAALLDANPTLGVFSDIGASPATINGNGAIINSGGIQYIRDSRPNLAPTATHTVEGTPTSGANSHEVMVGTANRDYLHMRGGDDTAYGDGGNDQLFGDAGNDRLYGGDGDDTIDSGDGADLVDGGAGDDVIHGFGSGTEIGGFDQLIGGDGNDTIYGEEGIDKLSGGAGDDEIYGGGNTDPFTHGGDGNDYIDGGTSGDLLYGDDGDDSIFGGGDQDILEGGNGDDILRPGAPSQAIGIGSKEVSGGNGAGGVDTGFDLLDLSDWAVAPKGVVADFFTQANPQGAIDIQNLAWTQMEGVIGTQNADTIVGSDVNAVLAPIDNRNWMIGGTGSDRFAGNGGNDVIVGGSIRLDTLIGKYVQAGGADSLYNTYDAYTGATHRIASTDHLTAGLLGSTALGGAFAKHYTEYLKTSLFKNQMLGDGGADTASTDTVVLQGLRKDYTVVALNAAGTVIANPAATAAALASVFALKITDVSGTNLDGTDLVIGVENFQFADGTKTLAGLFGPSGSVGFTATQNPGGVINPNNAVRLQANSSIFDAANITAANPTGAVTTGITYAWRTAANAAISTNPNSNPFVDTQNRLVLHTTAATGTVVNEVATYAGGTKSVTTAWNMIVGTGGNGNQANNTLNGADKTDGAGGTISDALFGLAGNDILNGGAGNDWLDGGTDTNGDTMTGGAGNDTYIVDSELDSVSELVNGLDTGGSDTVRSSVTYKLDDNLENLTLQNVGGGGPGGGGGGANNFDGAGNGQANVITGNNGNNVLTGLGGDDRLIGGQGNDRAVFTGSIDSYTFTLDAQNNVIVTDLTALRDGTDTLTTIESLQFATTNYNLKAGTSGNNTITAVNAPEVMIGGAGADTFVFNSTNAAGNGNNRALIMDFQQGVDHINLSGIDANTTVNGNQAFNFIGTAAFSDTNPSNALAAGQVHYLLFDADGNGTQESTLIQGNVNNTLTPDFEILLRNYISPLTAGDFTL